MLKILIFLLIFGFSYSSMAAVRHNPYTGMWEGNICMNNLGWAFVPWQPIGSLCRFVLPDGRQYQGVIINQ